MSASLKHYLTTIENALKAGNATEHTHRPALKALLESLDLRITATNEPKRIACGAPDYIITRDNLTIGYIEAKDVGKSLAETERSDQLKRYRRALANLILTDYLEFRWYVDGELRQTACLAQLQPGGKLKTDKNGLSEVAELLQNFLAHRPQAVNTPKDLAERMARLTHIIRDIIVAAFDTTQASMLLQGWREAFAKVLIADLSLPEKTPDFADMFAQTLAYGLFTARVMLPTPLFPPVNGGMKGGFTRQEAQYLIPKSNPFLRDFFIQITGPQLDDEPFASFVDDLVNLLAHTDMAAVLTDFGRRTRQEDPVVHFYETFLAAYDPKLRESRGVYYTPEPVVSYIVRSVDHLLKTRFDCPAGLADSSAITVPNRDPGQTVKGTTKTRKTTASHKVLILDPATGTGTFLYAVIDHIRQQFMRQGNAGMWPGYVKNHLLPRLFGFELLMAPYAVAHFKLTLQLAGRDLPAAQAEQWAYHFDGDERLGIYLTNALEEAHEMTGLPLFTQWVADETNAANEVKQFLPVLVVMGNPPYSGHSANKSAWIDNLLKGKLPDGSPTGNYYQVDGQPLGEKNPKWLQDDYVKFIRFGQWRIERSGGGILAFISNNGYLDNPTFRGMRQQLMQSFTEIYILNLHGNSKKKETAPDGSNDKNVFDIQQGVTIGIFVKQREKSGPAQIFYADLWGDRGHKYQSLFETALESTRWNLLKPQTPFYLFVPQDTNLSIEYEMGWKITDIMLINGWGVATRKDYLLVDFSRDVLVHRFKDIRSLSANEAIDKYQIKESPHWNFANAKGKIQENVSDSVKRVLFRPFDIRYVFYEKFMIERGDHRYDLMAHMFHSNLSLITVRRSEISGVPKHFFCTNNISVLHSISAKEGNFVFPLYLYPTAEAARQKSLFDPPLSPRMRGDEGEMSPRTRGDERGVERVPNLNPAFVRALEQKLGLVFQPHPPTPSPLEGKGSDNSSPSPQTGRGPGGGVWLTPPGLWQKLKPLARQMRHEPTLAEDKLWQQLRHKQLLNLKFRRQHAIDRFIVDFYCREARLIIEVDGPIHDYTQTEDAIRQEFLESQGYRVLRFSNEQVLTEIEAVLEEIALAIRPYPPTPSPLEGRGSDTSFEGRGSDSPPPKSGEGLGEGVFTPEDIFHYIYAVFHAPAYRARYAEFLKIDFPRVPLTSDTNLFWSLCRLGAELVSLHLLEFPLSYQERGLGGEVRYPIAGDNRVEKGYPRYVPPQNNQAGRVTINPSQYFEGVPPAVWAFHIGGYQVCEKWLKDRHGRQLSYDDLTHYQKIIVALQKTIELMEKIDKTIPQWPIE